MRILLVRPPVPRHTIGLKHVMICEPLELEYVAAHLNGHDVEIMDMLIERGFEKRLRRFKPDIMGTSSYITGVNEVIKLCRHTKRWRPECLTVVGGVHASVAAEDYIDDAVDCIVPGDGTMVMPEIVDTVVKGGRLEDVAGLALPDGHGSLRRTAARAYISKPDLLPFPRRDLLDHLRHKYYYLFHQPVATMKTTWGCWYTCNFCVTWTFTGGTPYSRSPESIVEELAQIKEKDVYIVDDIWLINTKRLNETARLIRERGIRKNYLVYGRADYIAQHEDVIADWADLGLTAVIVGLEASTNAELDSMNKECTVDQNRAAIDVLRRHGVDTYGSLIPNPDYSIADWNRLQKFIDDTGLYYVNISPLTPLPGTSVFKEYEAQLTVDRKAHGLWDLSHCVLPTRLPLKTYYRMLLRTYARTVLNINRANRLTLRTRPPVWSRKYMRLWLGAARIFIQFMTAHRHHRPAELARARDRGPELEPSPQLSSRKRLTLSRRRADSSLTWKGGAVEPAIPQASGPINPFEGFISPQGELPANVFDGLLDLPAVRRWFEIFAWGRPLDLYTYQQPFEGKTGPHCRLAGESYRMLSSYDYLGFIGHPEIEAAAIDAIRRYGVGTGGVRLLTGTTELHKNLEASMAAFKRTEACVSFDSGYSANMACLSALLGPSDLAILDARVHRSVKDACRMARVPVRTFAHNDTDALKHVLRNRKTPTRTLIVVEGVYSMDGDICPLPSIVELKQQYGAFLMVDEAHSVGVLGRTGRGVDEHFDLPADAVDIWMGTFSKALGCTGGYIAGSRALVAYLQHGGAPFMFSAAASPPTVAATLEALRILRQEPERVSRVTRNAQFIREHLTEAGFDIGHSESHIIPVMLGTDEAAWRFSRELFGRGVIALAVVPPAVAVGRARLRLCATAAQDTDFLESTLRVLATARPVEMAAT